MAALNRTRFSSVWMLVRTLYLLFQVQELLDRPPPTGSCNVLHCCGGAGDLDQVAVEEACDGNFVDLKKGLFVLRRSEAPLLAKVQCGFCMCPSGTSWCPWTSSRPGHQLVPVMFFFFLDPAGSGAAALAPDQRILCRHGSADPPEPGRKSASRQQRKRLLPSGRSAGRHT